MKAAGIEKDKSITDIEYFENVQALSVIGSVPDSVPSLLYSSAPDLKERVSPRVVK